MIFLFFCAADGISGKPSSCPFSSLDFTWTCSIACWPHHTPYHVRSSNATYRLLTVLNSTNVKASFRKLKKKRIGHLKLTGFFIDNFVVLEENLGLANVVLFGCLFPLHFQLIFSPLSELLPPCHKRWLEQNTLFPFSLSVLLCDGWSLAHPATHPWFVTQFHLCTYTYTSVSPYSAWQPGGGEINYVREKSKTQAKKKMWNSFLISRE